MSEIILDQDAFELPDGINTDWVVNSYGVFETARKIFEANLPADVLAEWKTFEYPLPTVEQLDNDRNMKVGLRLAKALADGRIIAIQGDITSFSERKIREGERRARSSSEGWHNVHEAGRTEYMFFDNTEADARPILHTRKFTQYGIGHPGNFRKPTFDAATEKTTEQLLRPYNHERALSAAAIELLLGRLVIGGAESS